MKFLRTPDECFDNLKNYPFQPNYLSINDLRMHYIREGDATAPTVLLLHGEPTWSYLYRNMITPLKSAGFQVIAPDLIGFGKSDKPISPAAYTYNNHIEWLQNFVRKLDLRNIILYCQDWGSLIGLRVAIREQTRFSKIILSNGGLPEGNEKIPKAFHHWQLFAKYSPWFPIGRIIQQGTIKILDKEIIKAYDAPFPSSRYKIGARIFPQLVPTHAKDPESKNNQHAWNILREWQKPFLTAFSNRDPITRGGAKKFQLQVPGCKDIDHRIIKNAGHFLQEDKSEDLVDIIINF
tara:strand:+ start:389 stop:1267 length:879 start_codon:yes stop_codon:yes gene_type:complete